MLYVLENSILNSFVKDAEEKLGNEYYCHVDNDEQVACVMLSNMSPKLQMQYKNMDAHTMIMQLK